MPMTKKTKLMAPIRNSTPGPIIVSIEMSVTSPSPPTTSLPSVSGQIPADASVGEVPVASVIEGGKKASQSSSSLKRSSSIWDHFISYDKIVKGKDEEGNEVDMIEKRAYCKYCPRGKIGDFGAAYRNGTSEHETTTSSQSTPTKAPIGSGKGKSISTY